MDVTTTPTMSNINVHDELTKMLQSVPTPPSLFPSETTPENLKTPSDFTLILYLCSAMTFARYLSAAIDHLGLAC